MDTVWSYFQKVAEGMPRKTFALCPAFSGYSLPLLLQDHPTSQMPADAVLLCVPATLAGVTHLVLHPGRVIPCWLSASRKWYIGTLHGQLDIMSLLA